MFTYCQSVFGVPQDCQPGKYKIVKKKQVNHENRQSPGKKKKQDQEKNLAKLLIKIMSDFGIRKFQPSKFLPVVGSYYVF